MVATKPVSRTETRCFRDFQAHACWVKSGSVVEGRAALRMPFDETVVLTPWNVETQIPAGRSMIADGRDISPAGLSFRHSEALPWRYVAVSFDGRSTRAGHDEPTIESVLVRLLWCRFVQAGAYLSGGRFEKRLSTEFGMPFQALFRREIAIKPASFIRERQPRL